MPAPINQGTVLTFFSSKQTSFDPSCSCCCQFVVDSLACWSCQGQPCSQTWTETQCIKEVVLWGRMRLEKVVRAAPWKNTKQVFLSPPHYIYICYFQVQLLKSFILNIYNSETYRASPVSVTMSSSASNKWFCPLLGWPTQLKYLTQKSRAPANTEILYNVFKKQPCC